MKLKRDNWTNKDIINIVERAKIVDRNGNHKKCEHNQAINDLLNYFKFHFSCPVEELGALAYDPEKNQILHVGEIPEEMKIKVERTRKKNEGT